MEARLSVTAALMAASILGTSSLTATAQSLENSTTEGSSFLISTQSEGLSDGLSRAELLEENALGIAPDTDAFMDTDTLSEDFFDPEPVPADFLAIEAAADNDGLLETDISSEPLSVAGPQSNKRVQRPPHLEWLSLQAQFGKRLYFDTNLSEPDGQSCASCHTESAGRADPDLDFPISEGVIPGIWGSRNAPSTGYTMFNPGFRFDAEAGEWTGGHLLDGRASGDVTGDSLHDQALLPFTNPLEMNNPDKRTVVRDASKFRNRFLFRYVCGSVDLSNDADVDDAFSCIAKSISEFERTREFAKFNSRYDYYVFKCVALGDRSERALDNCAKGLGPNAQQAARRVFNRQQWTGLRLFMRTNNNDGVLSPREGAGCVSCHTADWSHVSDYDTEVRAPLWSPEGRVPPLFTDFSYENNGIPVNEHFLLEGLPTDLGLGGWADFLAPQANGKFKVSSLRNIEKTAPYGHNGLFNNLEKITSFYNTRDTGNFGAAEVQETVNRDQMGNLGLTATQESELVEFMKTLTDRGL